MPSLEAALAHRARAVVVVEAALERLNGCYLIQFRLCHGWVPDGLRGGQRFLHGSLHVVLQHVQQHVRHVSAGRWRTQRVRHDAISNTDF